MATTTATFSAPNTGTLRQVLSDVLYLLGQENEAAPPAVTITGNTAGSVTFAIAAYQSNPAYSKAVTASVS